MEPWKECGNMPKRLKVSWSSLKRYEQCGMRQKLNMEKKQAHVVDGRVFLPGNLADRAMRRWLEEEKFDIGGMKKFLPELWDEFTGKDAENVIRWKGDPLQDRDDIIKTVTKALDKLEPILFLKVVPHFYQPEARFTVPIKIPGPDGTPAIIELVGGIDVLVKDKDTEEFSVWDLKTSRSKDYLSSTLAQVTMYDLAVKAMFGVHPTTHGFFTPLLRNTTMTTDVTVEERRALMARIVRYAQGIWAEEFPLTRKEDEWMCKRCEVRDACPKWNPIVTKDELGRRRAQFGRRAK